MSRLAASASWVCCSSSSLSAWQAPSGRPASAFSAAMGVRQKHATCVLVWCQSPVLSSATNCCAVGSISTLALHVLTVQLVGARRFAGADRKHLPCSGCSLTCRLTAGHSRMSSDSCSASTSLSGPSAVPSAPVTPAPGCAAGAAPLAAATLARRLPRRECCSTQAHGSAASIRDGLQRDFKLPTCLTGCKPTRCWPRPAHATQLLAPVVASRLIARRRNGYAMSI